MLETKELHERLERWANFARSPSIGSVSSVSGYLKERLDTAADSQEMTDEVWITEKAVARTRLQDKMFYKIIKRYYLGRLSICEIALDLDRSESSINVLFLRALRAVVDNIYRIEDSVDRMALIAENTGV